MKKLISIAILFVMIVALSATMVSAATKATLADELSEIGGKYGVSKAIIERMINEVGVADDDVDDILDLAQKADKIMTEAKVTDPSELKDSTQRTQLIDLANRAAAITGAKLTFKNGEVSVTNKAGKSVGTFTMEDGKLVQTGSSNLVFVVLAGVAIIAVAGTVVAKKVRS